MKSSLLHIILLFTTLIVNAQNKIDFDGQTIGLTNYSFNNDLNVFLGIRYLPELTYKINIDTFKTFDIETSANIYGAVLFHPFDTAQIEGQIQPYRVWMRYATKQLELRLGLQKIDFGSATLIRPIQWFNQIDPRDPLGLTNGVYAFRSRYYFKNNANLWFWVLYGNHKPRGFDVLKSNWKFPELGGRFQYPIPKGEVGLSYHYRTSSTADLPIFPIEKKIAENRIGIDAKWDLKIGLWIESSFIHQSKNIGVFTNQALFNLGVDYTFGLGNGLYVAAEHLTLTIDEKAFAFKNRNDISALLVSYPFGLFDNVQTIFYFNWLSKDLTFFVNYEHQFKKIVAYFMAYYNPINQTQFQQNDLVNQFQGWGLRLMIVHNH